MPIIKAAPQDSRRASFGSGRDAQFATRWSWLPAGMRTRICTRTTSRPKLSRARRRRDTLPPHFRPAAAEPWRQGRNSREGLPMIRATLSCACVVAVSVVSNVPARADKPINLEARFAQGVMKGGEKQRNYLRVGLNGCERPADRAHAGQRRLRDRPFRLDAGHAHRAGARGGRGRDPPARQERHRVGRDLRRQDRRPGAGAAGRRPCRLHRPHPADHRPRLDRDPRRRHRGRAAGAAEFRPAPPQPRGAAVGRPGQCRAAPARGFRQARPRAAAAGNLGRAPSGSACSTTRT